LTFKVSEREWIVTKKIPPPWHTWLNLQHPSGDPAFPVLTTHPVSATLSQDCIATFNLGPTLVIVKKARVGPIYFRGSRVMNLLSDFDQKLLKDPKKSKKKSKKKKKATKRVNTF
jgi:hypothetical protein